jgi:thioredoxin 2
MSRPRVDERGIIVPCPACGRPNRLAFGALGKATRCGHCKAAVPLPASPVEMPDAALFDAAAASPLPLIVDFWAPWCAPCRMVAPELERVARQVQGRYLVVKVNTDQAQDLAARFRISSIPTLAIVHHGREIQRVTGARSAAEIIELADRSMAEHARRAS